MTVRRPLEGRALRPWFPALLFSLAFVALVAGGCDLLQDDEEAPDEGVAAATSGYGGCWPAHGGDVRSMSTTEDGLVLYVSGDQPSGWPGDSAWDSDWHSLNVLDLESGLSRYLATTWESGIEYAPAATAEAGGEPPAGTPVVEQIATVRAARQVDLFVLGTTIDTYGGGLASLYSGAVPPSGNTQLTPDDGLSRIPVNDPVNLQMVRLYEPSPDGSAVAAVVGEEGELRVYDIEADQLILYGRDEEGAVELSHEAPPAGDPSWRPAYATRGVVHLGWSPDSSTLAVSRAEPRGITTLSLLDVATGEMVEVVRFTNSTIPHVQFVEGGNALMIMRTDLDNAGKFGDTHFARVEAGEDATVVESGSIERKQGFRTEPALLTRIDDETFLFTWEGGLWRLSLAEGGARAVQVSVKDDQNVDYMRPGAVPRLDTATYRNLTPRNEGEVAVRDHLSADECPVTEEGEPVDPDGAAGGEGGDDSASEGDANGSDPGDG